MTLFATLVGSYPPVRRFPPALDDEEVKQSIRDAVARQQEVLQDGSVRWLFVSGQPQRDVVGIFAAGLGLGGTGNPYIVEQDITYHGPITYDELEITAQACDYAQIKAHVTGPTLIAESCEVLPSAPARYREADAPRLLTLDLARALAEEARHILNFKLPVAYLQIDEPTLVYGANLTLAREALEILVQPVRGSQIQTILHVCGDVGDIMQDLLEFPVDVLNVELRHINEIGWLDRRRMADSGKKLALGCIAVNRDDTPSILALERDLFFARERYGAEHIWGITPSCGLRMSTKDKAYERLQRLAEVAEQVSGSFEQGRAL
jgi:5-methyltetrahydropteroyltriglutamate--homocysteine methyltransferase